MESLLKHFPKATLIPLIDNEKVPTTAGWTTTDLTKEALKKTNKGFATGGDTIVLDWDTYKVPTPMTLEMLIEQFNTFTVQTPKGGFHTYFKQTEKTKNWKGKVGLLDFIDCRTTGNYVVAPGSIIDGKAYTVVHDVPANCSLEDECNKVFFDAADEYFGSSESKTDLDIDENVVLELEKLFTNIKWKTEYSFDCDQRGKKSRCPLCDKTHESNYFFVSSNPNGDIHVKNFSQRCSSRMIKNGSKIEGYAFKEPDPCKIENDFSEYEKMKTDFEKGVCQIMVPDSFLMSDQYGDHLISKTDLFNIFAHEKEFLKKWCNDRKRKIYHHRNFLPGLHCPPDVLNMFKGFDIIKKSGGTVEPYLDILKILSNHNEESLNYIEQWIAKMIQKPGEMPRTALVFKGEQGTGKNSNTEVLKRVLGPKLYFETSDPMNDLFGRFSTFKENKLCIVLNESDPKQTFPNNQKIKDLITNTSMNIESKGVKAYSVDSHLHLIFLSNNDVPIKIERGDRRMTVFQVSAERKGDSEYWKDFYEWIDKPESIYAVYDYLMNVKLTLNLETERPMTKEYLDIQESCLPIEIKWLTGLIVEDFPKDWDNKFITSFDLFSNYKASLPSRYESDIGQFGKLIKRLEIPGFEWSRTKHSNGYIINRKEVFKWLQAKKYTRETVLPESFEVELSGDY